jgi:hypothetical protein
MFKQCPECGQEYQQWVVRCADCDVALELAAGERLAPARESGTAPPPDDAVLLKLDEPRPLQALAQALQEHGISSWIESHTPPAAAKRAPQLGLSVRRGDVAAAREIAEDLVARSLPDLDGVELPEYDASACPACGTPTPESAASCGECGLEFPELDPSSGGLLR